MQATRALAVVTEYGTLRTYPRGVQICTQAEPVTDVYFIRSGVLKLTWSSAEGRETIVGLRWPGSFLGASSVIASVPSPATATAVLDSRLEEIPATRFSQLLRSDFVFTMRIHEAQSLEILEQARDLAALAIESAKQRFRNFVRKLAQAQPQSLCLPGGRLNSPLNKQDLAALLAIEPAHLSRLLSELAADGLIATNRQWIVIRDMDALLNPSDHGHRSSRTG